MSNPSHQLSTAMPRVSEKMAEEMVRELRVRAKLPPLSDSELESEGKERKQVVDPSTLEVMNDLAAFVGLLLKQDMVAYHRPYWAEFKEAGGKNVPGVHLNLGRPLTKTEQEKLGADLDKELGPGAVARVGDSGGVRILSWPSSLEAAEKKLPMIRRQAVKDAAKLVTDLSKEVSDAGDNLRMALENESRAEGKAEKKKATQKREIADKKMLRLSKKRDAAVEAREKAKKKSNTTNQHQDILDARVIVRKENETFIAKVKKASATAFADSDIHVGIGLFHFHGGDVSNDWTVKPDGDVYRHRLASSRRRDLYRGVYDQLAPLVQEVRDDFSERYGWGDPGSTAATFAAAERRDDVGSVTGFTRDADPLSPMYDRTERGLGPVDHDSVRARAHVRLQQDLEGEEQAMLDWVDDPDRQLPSPEQTYVWRGVIAARALEALESGDEGSLKRNQALQLAWDEAGEMWAMTGQSRQERFQDTPEEEAYHDIVEKLSGTSEKTKHRYKKVRTRERIDTIRESDAQRRLDKAQQEAGEHGAIAAAAEQEAATTDDEAQRRDSIAEAKDARQEEGLAKGRVDKATKDRDKARSRKNKTKTQVAKVLANDGKRALEAQKQVRAAGYDTSEEGLREIAADPIDHARVKVISGTAREIDWADRLNSIRRNFMLQGLATQGVNLVSPLLYTAEQQLPLVLEATLHHLTGGRVGQMGFPALGRLWGGFYAHLGEAATNSLISFRTGTQFFESEVMKKAGSSRAEAPRQAFSGKWGWGLEFPQRLLGAVDDFYKTQLTLSYLDAYGYQQFRGEGQTHEQAVESMADVMSNPQHDLWNKALIEAQRLTFTSRIDNVIMDAARSVRTGKLKEEYKDYAAPGKFVAQQIMPFQDTPVNVLSEGIKQTPAGLLWILSKEVVNAKKEGDWSQFTSRSMQMAVGTMIGYALMQWVLGDDDEYPWITGTEIENSPENRELYNRRGMPQSQSFRIGDTWWSYERFDPLATVLSLSVDAINSWRRGESVTEAAVTAGQSLTRASVDKTFFSGISDIAEAIKRGNNRRPGETGTDAATRGFHHWGIGYAAGWVPALPKNFIRAQQDVYPERGLWGKGSEFGERVLRRYVQRAELGLADDRPRVALFGEEIPRHTPFSNPYYDWAWKFASPIKTKAHDPFIGNRIIMNWNRQNPKAQLNPRSPRYIRIKDTTIYLTDEQLEDYARLGGGNARKIIEYVESQGGFDDPANPSLKDKEIVKRAVERGYRQARKKLRGKWNQDHAIRIKTIKRDVETGRKTEEQGQEMIDRLRSRRQYVAP